MSSPSDVDGDEDLFGALDLDLQPEPEDEPAPRRRAKKPYHEAIERPPTALQARADASDDGIFGLDDSKPTLNEMYPHQSVILERKGTNGLTVVSTFTGCGGSSTGFTWAGWNELLCNEFVDAARDTLAANYSSYIVTPEMLLQLAEPIAEDIGVDLVVEKASTVKGKLLPAAVNWELTIQQILVPDIEEQVSSSMIPAVVEETADEKPFDDLGEADDSGKAPAIELEVSTEGAKQVDRLRFLVTQAALKEVPDGVMPIWGDDIRIICPNAVMEHLGIQQGDLDAFEGSPPCKSFSTSGLGKLGWGNRLHYSDERVQRTDDLFYEYLRLLEGFRPRSFVAENVAGLAMGAAESEVLLPLLEEFRSLGYRVSVQLVEAKDYGVPQVRPRILFMGIREDQYRSDGSPAMPQWPDKHPWVYTVSDALEAAAPDNTQEYLDHVQLENRPNGKPDFETAKIWHTLRPGASPSNKAWQLVRCHPNQPAPTITATSAGNQPAAGPTHPFECRKFTIPEYRRLFGFPRDYRFTGTLDQQGERMGRSVPPYLMMQIASSLADVLLDSTSVEES